MKNILICMLIFALSFSVAACSFFPSSESGIMNGKDGETADLETKEKLSSGNNEKTDDATLSLPEDEYFESQVVKEGMNIPVKKVRHYTKLGFSLDYPADYERYTSDDAVLIKWYDSFLTIKLYQNRDMESVKKEVLSGRINMTEDVIELAGKEVHRSYFAADDIEAFYFIENDGMLYVATSIYTAEAWEGVGVDFHDALDSIRFY